MPTASYIHGNYIDEVLSMRRADGSGVVRDYYYHQDDLFNATLLSDSSGAAVERYDYGDYGTPRFFDGGGAALGSSTLGNARLFNGREWDAEVAMYYYRTRYLEPSLGRFTARDTIGVWGDRRNVGNGVAYVSSSPGSFLDSFGRCGFTIKCTKIGGVPGSHCHLDFGDGDVGSAHNPPGWPMPGPITPYFGPWEQSPDRYIEEGSDAKGPLGPTRTTQISCPQGTDCAKAKQCVKDVLDKIGKCKILYDPFGPNSNTSLGEAFSRCLTSSGCSIGKEQPSTAPFAPPVGWPPISDHRSHDMKKCLDGDNPCSRN